MPNLPISRLPAATLPLSGLEPLPIVQVGTTVKATVNNLLALVPAPAPGPPGPPGPVGPPAPLQIEVVYSALLSNIGEDTPSILAYTPPVNSLVRISCNGWPVVASSVPGTVAEVNVIVTDPSGGTTGLGLFVVGLEPIPQNQAQNTPIVLVAQGGQPISFTVAGFLAWNGGVVTIALQIELLYPLEEELMPPTTVATLFLTNLSADIVNQILYSPSSKGIFQVIIYMCCTVADAGAGSLTVNIPFTDDSGPETVYSGVAALPLTAVGGGSGGAFPMECVANSTINFQATGGGAYGAARYSLYIVVQQIG